MLVGKWHNFSDVFNKLSFILKNELGEHFSRKEIQLLLLGLADSDLELECLTKFKQRSDLLRHVVAFILRRT